MVSRERMIDFVRDALDVSGDAPVEFASLSARGSDRTFHRITWGEGSGSYILIHYDPVRTENAYYADITDFLSLAGIPVPLVIRHDALECLLLVEDLGDKDLWSFRNTPWSERRELYHRTLFVANRLHSFPVEDFPADRVRTMEGFNPALYQWERDYFREHFVCGALGITLPSSQAETLEEELSGLAGRLHDTGQCLVHRDLQSQNVMIREGEPYLIDFQGMRFGSLFYDLGSLLMDPYVELAETEIEDLLLAYFEMGERALQWPAFRTLFWEASVQRLMQALGAYGFLGRTKRLSSFLAHIPAGLAHLERAAARTPSLPRLRELLALCRKKWDREGEAVLRVK